MTAPRLNSWDYSEGYAYFLTICTNNRQNILAECSVFESAVVGRGIPDAPAVRLSPYGSFVQETLEYLNTSWDSITIFNYVIMPDHIHILVQVHGEATTNVPANAVIPKFVSALKRFTNKKFQKSLWQSGYHDHIIRNQLDFQKYWSYIDNNPHARILKAYPL